MEYRHFGDTYVVRLDRGEEVIAALTELCQKEQIQLGTVTGLGASDHVVVGLYHVEERRYDKKLIEKPMEITSLVGNISTREGETYLHLHINLCDESLNAFGGHLNECRISATGELFVRKIDGRVERRVDEEETGLNLYRFL
ncbi:MAG: PPC domain-containing DNA-binding protein [Ndongobacter sp.]|nr:PPC domain-containing DNA-binding protein [Ndongobacter sp.]